MDIPVTVAGLLSLMLAAGHMVVGARWVFPALSEARFPATPIGSGARTLGMIRFSWIIVSVFAAAMGVLLLALGASDGIDVRTVVLRTLAVAWGLAGGMALWGIRRRLGSLTRFPVPAVFVVVAALCWVGSL
jgi:hypothetical protein